MLQIFIVSLKQDLQKRNTISSILEGFGLDFTFIDAVYGKELPIDCLNAIGAKGSGSVLSRGFLPTPGEVGCTLSHLKVYKEVLNRGLEWACILEDDVILDDRFEIFIKKFEGSDLNKESLYLLGGQNGISGASLIIKSYKNFQIIGGQKFCKTIKSEGYINRSCCYLINSYLAKELLDLSNTTFILADDWKYLLETNLINNIYLSDFVDHPIDLTNSHIHDERADAALRKIRPKVSFFKKVKSFTHHKLRPLVLKSYKFIEKKD